MDDIDRLVAEARALMAAGSGYIWDALVQLQATHRLGGELMDAVLLRHMAASAPTVTRPDSWPRDAMQGETGAQFMCRQVFFLKAK